MDSPRVPILTVRFPRFETWLEDCREDLEEEWQESLDDGGIVERYEDGQDFLQWARLAYDNEKQLHLIRNGR